MEGSSSSDTFQVTSTKSGLWANSSLRVKVDRVPNITVSCEGKNPQGTHTLLFQLVPGEGWGRRQLGHRALRTVSPIKSPSLFTTNQFSPSSTNTILVLVIQGKTDGGK